MKAQISSKIEEIFPTAQVPEVISSILGYSFGIWPRLAYQFDPESKRLISLIKISSYKEFFEFLESFAKIILITRGIYPPYFKSVLLRTLGDILSAENYRELPFQIDLSPNNSFLFIPQGSGFDDKVGRRYDLPAMMKELFDFGEKQDEFGRIFRNLADSRQLTEEKLKSLTSQGWDPNLPLDSIITFWTPLNYIVSPEMTELLLKNGADPNKFGGHLAMLIELALEDKNGERIKEIEDKALILYKYNWNPIISESDLEVLAPNIDQLRIISPTLFDILQSAKVIP